MRDTANLEYHAVAFASALVAWFNDVPDGLASLLVGITGVALARWVFVNREVRMTNQPQPWRETLPLTLVAMLITVVLIWDRKFSISTSAFVGLGVGWTTVLLLDVIGHWLTNTLRRILSAGPADPTFPRVADWSGKNGRVPKDQPEDITKLLNQAGNALDEVYYLPPTEDEGKNK